MRRLFFVWFRFTRAGMSPLTMSIPLLGWLSTGASPSFGTGLALCGLGLAAHGFGFGLNDLIDAPLDAKLRPQHPLQTGELSRRGALLILGGHLLVALALAAFLSWKALAWLLLSLCLSLIYNFFSKWGGALLAELCLAASISSLCLAGGFAAPHYVYALSLGLVLLCLNSLPSGLKDLKTDAEFGARSFVIVMGARAEAHDSLFIPPILKIYAGILLLLLGACWLYLRQAFGLGFGWSALSLLLLVYGGLHLRLILTCRHYSELKGSLPLLSGYYHYAALLLILAPRLALLPSVALLLVPIGAAWRTWRVGFRPLGKV